MKTMSGTNEDDAELQPALKPYYGESEVSLDELQDRTIDVEATGELRDRESDESPFDARSQQTNHVSEYECVAIRSLYIDGWTATEIAFALERNEKTVLHHINHECTHE